MRNVNLVVVAHPDDEILGFGGAGAKLVTKGESVQAVILCGNVNARDRRPTDEQLYQDMLAANKKLGFEVPVLGTFPNIKMNTVDHLSIVQFIEKQIMEFQPNRIFTHHPSDLNDDHVHVSKACLAASRLYQRRNDVTPLQCLSFIEIQSSTDWSYEYQGAKFSANHFVEINDTIDKKIEALSCYRGVMRDFPHPRSPEALKGLAAYRGGQSGQLYAEAFQTILLREFI
ncbi:PIG-L deacetylase family protein [Planctobacterium marinum]|uniref:PIG-L deacetylase family protein n=1 Tax=Planctobacterium marinum TaxID=1631968 RepID=UPI001E38F2EF|nr:PIG-L deacetylase family protein [Planctobacterium marinum]MCC2606137.1 PIG-L family deacetylase [Planctobacterium marinum]